MNINNKINIYYYYNKYSLFFSKRSIKYPFYKLFSLYLFKLQTVCTIQPKYLKDIHQLKLPFFFINKPLKINFFRKDLNKFKKINRFNI